MSRKTSRSSRTRRALKSVRGNVPGGTISTTARKPSNFCSAAATSALKPPTRASPACDFLDGLHPHGELVHRALARDDDAVLAAVSGGLVENGVDLARIDVLAADREHVVDAAEDAHRQPRVGAAARVRAVLPQRQVAREQPDHGLRGALEMGVDRGSALAVRHAMEAHRIADLGVDDILPAEHAVGLGRARDIHPRRHLAHRAAVEDLGAV